MSGDMGIFNFGGYTFFEKPCYIFKGQGWVTMIFLARKELELYVKKSFFFFLLHVKHSCKTLRICYWSIFTTVKPRHRLGCLLVAERGMPGSNRIQAL